MKFSNIYVDIRKIVASTVYAILVGQLTLL